jgi:hypothetical protein
MTTSGSRDFNFDVGEIIEEAYERCGLEVRTGYDAKTARRSLNLMFADWANRGLNLWTVKQATITLRRVKPKRLCSDDVVDLLDVVLRRITRTMKWSVLVVVIIRIFRTRLLRVEPASIG